MGSKFKFLVLASAGLMLSAGISAAKEFPTGDPQSPVAEIETESGIGTASSKIVAKISKEAVADWCGNWRPEDKDCVKDSSDIVGKTYTASADCDAGTMTTPSGEKVKWSGFNRGDDFYNYYQFENLEYRTKIGFSNGDEGVTVMAQWMTLCPFGLPFSVLPLTDTIDIHDEAKYGHLRKQPIAWHYEGAVHNGKHMLVDYDLGTITYHNEQSATIPEHRVLFRGSISIEEGLPTRGMAYAFKKGCTAQPYQVEGFYNGLTGQIVLEGAAPVWDGCEVSGYSLKSKNAKLVFQLKME